MVANHPMEIMYVPINFKVEVNDLGRKVQSEK